MSEIRKGDIVEIANPDRYAKWFADKVRGRQAKVMFVAVPLGRTGQTARIRFPKVGNAKAFEEVIAACELKLADETAQA